jgi:hypothetical protein
VNKIHFLNAEGTSGNTSIVQPIAESYGIPHGLSSRAPRPP